MDKTLINLLTILLGGGGLFSVLTKYSVPELNATFWGKNIFAVKRDIIEKVMTRIFILMSALGLVIQVFGEILRVPARIYSIEFYFCLFVIGFVVTLGIVFLCAFVGKKIAKIKWLPEIIKSQRELFNQAKYIIAHDCWREDQTDRSNSNPYKEINYQTAEKNVSQIEKLLEVKKTTDEIAERIRNIEPYFKN